MLKGAVITNNGYVAVDQIGRGDEALMCLTDKPDCCNERPNRAGEWYFPDKTVVNIKGNRGNDANYFFRTRGNRTVFLNSVNSPSERGRFYCKVPDANGTIQTVYVNIGTSNSLHVLKVIYSLVQTLQWILVL